MSSRRDTLPMAVPPVVEPTDRDARPAHPHRDGDTQPMLIAPVGPVPDSESVTPPDETTEEDALFRALDRPPRPPAPMPVKRASSEGGDFVAYAGASVPQPAQVDEARHLALVEIDKLAAAPDRLSDHRDEPTQLVTRRARKWRSIGAAVAAVVVLGVVLAAVVAVRAARAPAAVTPLASTATAPAPTRTSTDAVPASSLAVPSTSSLAPPSSPATSSPASSTSSSPPSSTAGAVKKRTPVRPTAPTRPIKPPESVETTY
jgi:hypothetical protein